MSVKVDILVEAQMKAATLDAHTIPREAGGRLRNALKAAGCDSLRAAAARPRSFWRRNGCGAMTLRELGELLKRAGLMFAADPKPAAVVPPQVAATAT